MDRRSFLKTAGLTAAGTAALASTDSFAASPASGGSPKDLSVPSSGRQSPASSDLSPWSPSTSQPWDVHTINHLYRRAGFGATLSEIGAASKLTTSQVVDALLDDTLLARPTVPPLPTHANDPSVADDKQIAPYWLHVPPTDYSNATTEMNDYAYANMKIRSHWAAQMNQPEVMLREKMTLFWMNHFVVEAKKVYYPQSMYDFLSYFRLNAWGNFKQMVSDVTTKPAMLIYLDGILNIGSAPNENYARELQELFTMGVYYKNDLTQPNYSQADVEAIAFALSGWSVDPSAPAPNVLPATYNPNNHGTKRVTIYDSTQRIYNLKASGASMDMDLIDHIFDQRGDQIAWYICSKLYQYFVYHDITGASELAIIDAMAATFKNGNWELKPVLTQLLKSSHFFDEANIGAEIKSPHEHLLGLIRTFDIQIDELAGGTLYYYAIAGAQELLDPPNVKGWPGYHNWISTTTLPYRNTIIESALLIQGSLAAQGADGYGATHLPVALTDAMVTTWGKQFVNYSGVFEDMVKEMATYLCAQTPSLIALTYIKSKMPSNTYEWPTLSDSDKLSGLRQMAKEIMLLADFQLS